MQSNTKSIWARRQRECLLKLKSSSSLRPTLGIVLGTGFQDVSGRLTSKTKIAYKQLPGFPHLSVAGHRGELFIGRLGGTAVFVLSGRAHFYEGHLLRDATFPVRALAAAGIRDMLLTNAAGGINPKFRSGDFMVIADHINLMGVNPLAGAPIGPDSRFVDLTHTYDQGLRRLLVDSGHACGARLHSGVYLAVSGPSYETPAEIRAFARLGADAVGMSTVPEAIVARHCNLRVAGLSCITNPAAGLSVRPLSHIEVLRTAQSVKNVSTQLIEKFAELYRKAQSDRTDR